MPHKIGLSFEDGITRFIECLDGEKIADAAYRHGVNIPLDCREGACGTCKVQLESGDVHMEDFVEDALSADEQQAGLILTCKSVALADCVVRVPVPSTLCLKAPAAPIRARIDRLTALGGSGFALTLGGAGIAGLDFLPGQYANLTVPGTTLHRAYSFSSLVDRGAGQVDFLIRRVPGGLMTSYLADRARIGDEIVLQGPLGGFYLRKVARPLLMLAGGTGLAPFLAMLQHLRGQGCAHKIHLIYGVNREDELVAQAELAELAAHMPDFTVTTCLARPDGDFPRIGFVSDFITADLLQDGDVDVYLCGPPPMVEAVEAKIADLGVSPATLHYEKFVAGIGAGVAA